MDISMNKTALATGLTQEEIKKLPPPQNTGCHYRPPL